MTAILLGVSLLLTAPVALVAALRRGRRTPDPTAPDPAAPTATGRTATARAAAAVPAQRSAPSLPVPPSPEVAAFRRRAEAERGTDPGAWRLLRHLASPASPWAGPAKR